MNLMKIQVMLEDLNEAGMDVHMVVSGFEINVTKGGMIVKTFNGNSFDPVAQYLFDLNADIIAEHGEMGGK